MAQATELLTMIDPKGKGKAPAGLDTADFKSMFRSMLTARLFDERGMNLQRQGRIGFFVPGTGQEASQIGAAYAMAKEDVIFPSYRTSSIALQRGVPMKTMYDQLWGNAADMAKGRQMPNHLTYKGVNWVSISSPIGTHISQAAGVGRAAQIKGDKVAVWAWFGEGGTSSNDFHAGLNFAGVWKSPCIFMCENNHWAISVPQHMQTASQTFADKAVAYGMPGVRVDGNDVFAVYEAARAARERALAGDGPTLIENVTFRMGPHSSSDDPSRYQPAELFEKWKKKDPIKRFRAWLKAEGIWTKSSEDELTTEIKAEIAAAVEAAESTPMPEMDTIFTDVYADMPQLLVDQFEGLKEQIRRDGAIEDTGGAFPL